MRHDQRVLWILAHGSGGGGGGSLPLLMAGIALFVYGLHSRSQNAKPLLSWGLLTAGVLVAAAGVVMTSRQGGDPERAPGHDHGPVVSVTTSTRESP